MIPSGVVDGNYGVVQSIVNLKLRTGSLYICASTWFLQQRVLHTTWGKKSIHNLNLLPFYDDPFDSECLDESFLY